MAEVKKAKATYQPWNVNNWVVFLKERAPPLLFLMIAAGPCLSVLYTDTGLPVEKFIWALLGQQALLVMVRIMDDVKDYEKDKVVHPDRPLPRGLIKYEEVVTFVYILLAATMTFGVLLILRYGLNVGLVYHLQVGFVFLMYVEFFIGEWLEKSPFLYALVHEVSFYIGAIFMAALCDQPWVSKTSLVYGTFGFSGFFVYDICRKLDPNLPKLKGTYLVHYGKWPVFVVTSLLVAMGMISSYVVHLHGLLWPVELLMLASLLALFLKPTTDKRSKAHKPVEGFSVVYLLCHLWVPFIAKLFLY